MKSKIFNWLRLSAIATFFAGIVSVIQGCTAKEGALLAALVLLVNFCSTVPTDDAGDAMSGGPTLNPPLPSGYLYTTDFDGENVLACDPTNCANTVITVNAGNGGTGMEFVGSDLYWLRSGGLMCDPANCDTPTVVSGLTSGYGLAHSGSTLIWVNIGANEITACDLSDCVGTTNTVIDTNHADFDSAIDIISDGGNNIYWTSADGDLQTCDYTSCTPSTLVSSGVLGMALDGSTLYWSGGDSIFSSGTTFLIQSCDLSNCAGTVATVIDVSAIDPATGIDVSGGILYWGDFSGNLNSCDVTQCLATVQTILTTSNFFGDVLIGP